METALNRDCMKTCRGQGQLSQDLCNSFIKHLQEALVFTETQITHLTKQWKAEPSDVDNVNLDIGSKF